MKPIAALGAHMTCLLLALPLVACRAHDGDALSSRESLVQFDMMSGQFEVVQDGSRASRATGALQIALRDPLSGEPAYDETGQYPVRGTCGVTFISPRYAVTAAHCAIVPDPEVDTIMVETYEVSGVDESLLQAAGELEGFFPDYTRVLKLEEVADYHKQSYECSVVARCSFDAYGNCGVEADVALLHCPDRRPDADWLPVAQGDPQTGPVEMYWFHEVLVMPVSRPSPSDPDEEHDRYSHYTVLNGSGVSDRADNFHYLEADANLLLPLKSVPWSEGQPRSRLGGGWTDLFGCHGTSGSGVLQENAQGDLELLGPARVGSEWSAGSLCNTFLSQPGQSSLSYTSNGAVLELEAGYIDELDEDRVDKGTCGCGNSGVGNICLPAVDLCEPGYGPHCDPFQGQCGSCYCE